MSIPVGAVPVQAEVRELAHGAALEPVWENNVGGSTFRTSDGRYIKH